MKIIKIEKGFSLIEVLASIVLVSVILMLVSSYFVKSMQHNSTLTNNYSSLQLCESLLSVYKSKDYSVLEKEMNKTLDIDINNELHLEPSTNLPFTAEVTIKKHASLAELLVIYVTVYTTNGKKSASLEGYLRK